MEAETRRVDEAAEIYLRKLDKLVEQGIPLAQAKRLAMIVAAAWLDADADRARWQPLITAALLRRSGTILVSRSDLDALQY
jgi:hypothetical protein